MPTTSNFGWTTPADTDLVKDGAAAIRTLGNGIDTSLVDLKGGTTGQVLAKASNTDLDFTWSSVDPLTILDAKGDLISATAADTPARLAVGSNGQVLTADSSTSTGLKWAAAGGNDSVLIATGSSYFVRSPGVTITDTSFAVNTTHYSPIYLTSSTLDRLNVKTAAAFTGSYGVRLGIYNSTNGKPSTVLLDAGLVTCNAASTAFSVTINQTINAGWYWLAANIQVENTAGVRRFFCFSGTTAGDFTFTPVWANNTETTPVNFGFTESSITGAFATAGSLTVKTDDLITTWARVA